jgi:hypothetical protein
MKSKGNAVDDVDRRRSPTKTEDSAQMVNLQNCNAGKILKSFGNTNPKQIEQ